MAIKLKCFILYFFFLISALNETELRVNERFGKEEKKRVRYNQKLI